MGSHKILPMVLSDVDVLVIHGDEGSHEETSEGVSTVPGRNWTGSFQEALVNPSTHRNAKTTGWKRVGRVSRDNTKARESILEENLAKNVSLSLHNSFCRKKEPEVKGLTNQAKRLQEQMEWMWSHEQLKAW